MTFSHGMNTDQIRGIGNRLKGVASNDIANLIGQIDKLVNDAASNWSGKDSNQFKTDWTGTHKKALKKLQSSLDAYGQKAISNANKQETTSSQY